MKTHNNVPWHKLTSLFSETMWDKIAVVQNSWKVHMPVIQQVEAGIYPTPVVKNVPPISNSYLHFPEPEVNKIKPAIEYNRPTYFHPLVQRGTDVHTYKKGEYMDTFSQSEPDNIFDNRKSTFTDKRVHGMDDKANEKPREFESKIFSSISEEQYITGISNLQLLIESNAYGLTKEKINQIGLALHQLKTTCNDIKLHQIVWAETLHHFPDKYIPAMRVPKNFALDDLRPEALTEYLKRSWLMNQISNDLRALGIPENDHEKVISLLKSTYFQETKAKVSEQMGTKIVSDENLQFLKSIGAL